MDKEEVRRIKKAFGDEFGGGQVGTIDDPHGTIVPVPVRLNGITATPFCTAERCAKYGAAPGEIALLVGWTPAGLVHTKPADPMVDPAEAGIDLKQIPDITTWVSFPMEFMGLPVHYKRVGTVFAR